MSSFEEKTISEEMIFEGKVISVKKAMIEAQNHKHYPRELVFHPGAVCILPVCDDGTIILVKQYRKAIESELWEIPAGKIEKGETDLYQVACRELEEEIQCEATLKQLMSFYPSPGFSNEKLTLFLATNIKSVSSPKPCDEDEFIEVKRFKKEELVALYKEAKLDAKTIIALQYYFMQLT